MDDDGMQFNFSAAPIEDGGGAARFNNDSVNFKGSWKKKRIVTKIAKSKAGFATKTKAKTWGSPGTSGVQVAIRDNRKIDALSKSPSSLLLNKNIDNSTENPSSKPSSKPSSSTSHKPKVNGSFVTSLFSGNPVITNPSTSSISEFDLPKQSSNAVPEVVTDTTTFKGLGLNHLLISHLENKMDIRVPTLIQQAVLASLIIKGDGAMAKDALVQAQTGSGKTLAFLLPIVDALIRAQSTCSDANKLSLNRSLGTVAIILAPTRELAKQIESVLELLLKYSSSLSSSSKAFVENLEHDSNDSDSDNNDKDADVSQRDKSKFLDKPTNHWIVPGLVVGGDKKKSEKARLRKGCTILVSTPGRLIDHLKTTQAFEIGNLRWLVLDEADRFLELGFEETLRELLAIIDKKRAICDAAGKRLRVRCWPSHKQIILTSATIKGTVARLAETSLREPVFIKAAEFSATATDEENSGFEMAKKATKGKDFIKKKDNDKAGDESDDDFWEGKDISIADFDEKATPHCDNIDDSNSFKVPEQLKQKYVIVPAKLRLVTLVAILRQISSNIGGSTKTIVFTDTCDSVDFLHHILANGHLGPGRDDENIATQLPKKGHPTISNAEKARHAEMIEKRKAHREAMKKAKADVKSTTTTIIKQTSVASQKQESERSESADEIDPLAPPADSSLLLTGLESPLLPTTRIYKLHGNCSQAVRAVAYKGFKTTATHAVLICTDVAARGLDLPDVSSIVQYDMPGDARDYVHRVGRTARLGREGTAVAMLLPSEAGYVDMLRKRGVVVAPEDGMAILKHLVGAAVGKDGTSEAVVAIASKSTRKPKRKSLEDWATDIQMMFERFIMASEKNLELARTAFRSHVRAYATHVSTEKQLFNIKNLHLGHVAKSFALRDAPGLSMGQATASHTKCGFKPAKEEDKGKKNSMKRKAYQLQSASSAASEFGDGGVQKLMGGMARKKMKAIY
ncbi:ATP-dependent RNA helicase dbp7 [Physocladia obscura]|uniref:ATP-dependent RNA helicase n=1 Tax=Physocladia obscura TaxID=109957 RepID=A0AAD5SWW2_9FUNG|nr:ATP-dependent RNA helicase dbp7 [Physocladia obscura]